MRDWQPETVHQFRSKVIAVLLLDGLFLKEIFYLSLPDLYPDLGLIRVRTDLVPISPSSWADIEAWLKVRPQRGKQQALITNLTTGRHLQLPAPDNNTSALLRDILDEPSATLILSATYMAKLIRAYPHLSDRALARLCRRKNHLSIQVTKKMMAELEESAIDL